MQAPATTVAVKEAVEVALEAVVNETGEIVVAVVDDMPITDAHLHLTIREADVIHGHAQGPILLVDIEST